MNTNLNSNIVTVDVPEDLREDLVQVWDALFEDRQSIISKGEDLLQGETISGGYYPEQKLFHFVYVSREREKKNKIVQGRKPAIRPHSSKPPHRR